MDLGYSALKIYSFTNTIGTFSYENGNSTFHISADDLGFKGMRKISMEACAKIAECVAEVAKNKDINKIELYLNSTGRNGEIIYQTIKEQGIEIVKVEDITKIPHNGAAKFVKHKK
ncbi:MAG: 30S ribosomal protein S11 [Clostridia bacterium]|nr:30S ribosomal protein S11 [Clostridia bacterium]